MKIIKKARATEAAEEIHLGKLDGVVVNGGGPVNTTNFQKDFEDAAEKLKKLLVIGNTTTGDGKLVKAEQLDIDPAGTPNPDKKTKIDKDKPKKIAKEDCQMIVGITDSGVKKYYNTELKDWVGSETAATQFSDPMKAREVWFSITKAKQAPAGFRRVFVPNCSAKESIIDRNSKRSKKDSMNYKKVKYSDKAYEAAATELDATLPPEYLNNPSEVNFKKILKKKADDEAEASRQKAIAERKAKLAEEAKPIIDKVKQANPEDQLQVLFDELVPQSGPAESVAGEIVRAMMRIQYRDWNGRDIFYEGYGLETAGPSAEYLMDTTDQRENFKDIAYKQLEGELYTNRIDEIASNLINYIIQNPDLIGTPNEDDSRDWGTRWLTENQPLYEYQCELPESIIRHLDNDDISERDLIWEIETWEIGGAGSLDSKNAEVTVQGSWLYIDNVNRDVYDDLKRVMERSLKEYGDQLDEEYGNSTSDDDNGLSVETNEMLDKAYDGSYFTIVGAGGDLEDWKSGIQQMLDKENIGKVSNWITFKGSDMNEKYHLTGNNAYKPNLTFLAFPLDGLDTGKLAIFKLRFDARWFDDIVDNF